MAKPATGQVLLGIFVAAAALIASVVLIAEGRPVAARRAVPEMRHAVPRTAARVARDDVAHVNVCADPSDHPTSLTDVERAAPFTLLMPNSPYANSANLSAAWNCSAGWYILQFSSGVSLTMEVNTIVNPAASWRSFVASDSDEASLATVHGQPAVVIDPAADPSGFATGGVTWVQNGIWISVGGNHRLTPSQLLSTADSLTPVA